MAHCIVATCSGGQGAPLLSALDIAVLLPMMSAMGHPMSVSWWFVEIGGRYLPMLAVGWARRARVGPRGRPPPDIA